MRRTPVVAAAAGVAAPAIAAGAAAPSGAAGSEPPPILAERLSPSGRFTEDLSLQLTVKPDGRGRRDRPPSVATVVRDPTDDFHNSSSGRLPTRSQRIHHKDRPCI